MDFNSRKAARAMLIAGWLWTILPVIWFQIMMFDGKAMSWYKPDGLQWPLVFTATVLYEIISLLLVLYLFFSHRVNRRSNKLKFTIIGAYGCGNIGDDAILEGMIKKIEQQYGEGHEITVLALDTEYVESQYPVRAIRQVVARGLTWGGVRGFAFNEIFAALRASDIVIIGGGSLIHDRRYYNLPYYVVLSAWSKLFGAKVFVRGVSVGPLQTRLGRWLFNILYRLSSEMTYRDDRSRFWVEKSGISGKEPTSDLAFMMHADHVRTQEQNDYIAVNICGWFRSEEYWGKDERVLQQEISSFAKLVDRLIEDFDKDVVFVNTVFPADSDVAKRIVQEMIHGNRSAAIDQIQSPREMKNLISSSAMLVGMRLHSIIFAVMTNTPFVAVNYDDKVKSFVERIGMEDYLLELEDLQDRDKVMDRCNKCWQNRHSITHSLHESAENLRRIIMDEKWS